MGKIVSDDIRSLMFTMLRREICGGMKRSINTIKKTANLSDEKMRETSLLMQRLGLKST